MEQIIILGLGNILYGDEGFGVLLAQRLYAHWDFPENVEVVDGGTQGQTLLTFVERADRLLVLDAVDFGLQPGQLLLRDNVPAYLTAQKIGPHQNSFSEVMHKLALDVKIFQTGNKGLASGFAFFLTGVASNFNRRGQQIKARHGYGCLAAGHARQQPGQGALFFGCFGSGSCRGVCLVASRLDDRCRRGLHNRRLALSLMLPLVRFWRFKAGRDGHAVKVFGHGKRIVRVRAAQAGFFSLLLGGAVLFFFKNLR